MPDSRLESHRLQPVRRATAVALVLVACACSAARTSTFAGTARLPVAEEAEWREFATARVAPLTGAVRVSVGQMLLVDESPRGLDAPPGAVIGLSELVAVGLLGRPDVRFVEQRRFAAAVDAERRGESRPHASATRRRVTRRGIHTFGDVGLIWRGHRLPRGPLDQSRERTGRAHVANRDPP